MTTFDRLDVQGLVVSAYGRSMREARYLLLGVTDPGGARQWLGDLANRVTASDKPEHVRCTNIAFTYAGLAALGLDEAELTTFPTPFQEGMVSEHRQRILGDTGASAPSTWNWGGNGGDDTATSADELHAILLLFGKDAATMDEVEAQEMHWLTTSGALKVLVRLAPEPLPGQLSVGKFGVEHFGFADGMSQPVIKGSGQDSRLAGDDARRSVIEAGEFILGYANGYGQIPPWPRLTLPGDAGGDFGRNASFLVVRQLAQDVAGFWKFLSEATKEHDGSANTDEMERLGAKLVGRWRSGAPLVRAHHRDDPDLGTDNSFGYAETDPFGERCPIGSHIRRSNPRDSLDSDPSTALELANLHRILRRGRVYGPGLADPFGGDDGRERGLFFMCINANLERQFEFVQHSWCNNPKFGGLYDEQDPLLGDQPPEGRSFTWQDRPFRRKVQGMPTFVSVRGGAYFFLPGLRALGALATLGR